MKNNCFIRWLCARNCGNFFFECKCNIYIFLFTIVFYRLFNNILFLLFTFKCHINILHTLKFSGKQIFFKKWRKANLIDYINRISLSKYFETILFSDFLSNIYFFPLPFKSFFIISLGVKGKFDYTFWGFTTMHG